MGYRTWVNIEVKDFDPKDTKTTKEEAFEAIIDAAEPCQLSMYGDSCEFEDNNGNDIDIITEESKKYPGLLLEGDIDGTSEDRNDQRRFRIRNGMIEEVSMLEPVYPPFTTLLTDEEKKRNTEQSPLEKRLCEIIDYAMNHPGQSPEQIIAAARQLAAELIEIINPENR